jgi:ribose transport system substrate-binding protein
MKAGIPVIELDRKSLGDPGKDYTAFIGGARHRAAGRTPVFRRALAAG